MIGQIIDGRYRILARLGEGGMSEVYLGEHIDLGRKEALKILHRGLKPDNIVISHQRGRDVLKVLDFGIAKIIAPDDRDRDGSDQSVTTGAGALFGTPYYMAPERVEGNSADSRSDIYAIGCIA